MYSYELVRSQKDDFLRKGECLDLLMKAYIFFSYRRQFLKCVVKLVLACPFVTLSILRAPAS